MFESNIQGPGPPQLICIGQRTNVFIVAEARYDRPLKLLYSVQSDVQLKELEMSCTLMSRSTVSYTLKIGYSAN